MQTLSRMMQGRLDLESLIEGDNDNGRLHLAILQDDVDKVTSLCRNDPSLVCCVHEVSYLIQIYCTQTGTGKHTDTFLNTGMHSAAEARDVRC